MRKYPTKSVLLSFPKIAPLLLLALSLFAINAFADSVLLKDGQEIKGEILSQDSNSILVEYFVTPTIKDEKTILRSDIDKIVTMSKDDKAFLALGSRATPQVVLDTTFYDELLNIKIPEFLEQYPYSRHIAELREDQRSLSVERERIRNGDRKIDGVWITAQQIAADPFQANAKIQFYEVRGCLTNNDPVTTLKAYELFERDFAGSSSMPEAVDLALSQLQLLQGNLTTTRNNFEIVDKKRQQSIMVMPVDQAKEVKDALEKENLIAKAAIAQSIKDGTKFFPIFPNNKEALDALQLVATQERARLLILQATPMRESLIATKEAVRLVSEEKYSQATDQLAIASKLWPANAEVAPLKQKLEAIAKRPTPKPSLSPSPSLSPLPPNPTKP